MSKRGCRNVVVTGSCREFWLRTRPAAAGAESCVLAAELLLLLRIQPPKIEVFKQLPPTSWAEGWAELDMESPMWGVRTKLLGGVS